MFTVLVCTFPPFTVKLHVGLQQSSIHFVQTPPSLVLLKSCSGVHVERQASGLARCTKVIVQVKNPRCDLSWNVPLKFCCAGDKCDVKMLF